MFLYHQLRKGLSQLPANIGGTVMSTSFEKGVLDLGRFEQYFGSFRTRILPLIHRRKTVDALLALQDLDEQRDFYKKRWNNFRWQGLFRIFSRSKSWPLEGVHQSICPC